jgi:hypothetical protein
MPLDYVSKVTFSVFTVFMIYELLTGSYCLIIVFWLLIMLY